MEKIAFISGGIFVYWSSIILTLAVLAISLLCMVKAYMTEFYVCRHLRFPLWRELLVESAMTALFMLSGWYGSYFTAMALYAAGYALYLLLERQLVKEGIQILKSEMREKHEGAAKSTG